MSTSTRLTEIFESDETKEIPFDDSSKFILLSDCHRGDNSRADDFSKNQDLFFHSLNHYYDQGFTYIELGDGDELWENPRFDEIKRTHSNAFWLMSEFHKGNRLHLIWGNHNRKWRNRGNVRRHLHVWETREGTEPLFDGIEVHEGLILRHSDTDKKILLVHGHQGQLLNDALWPIGKYFVRNIWRGLQLCGFSDPTSPAKNHRTKGKVEKAITDWAIESNQIVIAGHTHRPMFHKPGESPYFNTGSCVHPRCITGIEICNGAIALVKWFIKVDGPTRALHIGKESIRGPEKLEGYFQT